MLAITTEVILAVYGDTRRREPRLIYWLGICDEKLALQKLYIYRRNSRRASARVKETGLPRYQEKHV